MFTSISKFILLTLLLLSQGSVLAHELDLDAHQSNDTCEVCLLHSALDDAQASGTISPLFAANNSPISRFFTPALNNKAPRHFHARAPPIPTFV
jgi:hypothetical protein